jgi:hypothetical protein
MGGPIRSTSSHSDFAPVSSEEMGFALTLFVEAANRRLTLPVNEERLLTEDDEEVYANLFHTLCADVERSSTPASARPGHETTLYAAFQALLSFYEGDPHQVAIGARVLAFYFLMTGSEGEVLADWIEPHPETTELVSLHPAVIDALGIIPLNGSVVLSPSSFLELVAKVAAGID